jgi:hypothetical protein
MGFVFMAALLGCQDQESKVYFSVKAKNSEGKPLGEAQVKLNDQAIGKTDMNGLLEYSGPLPVGKIARIQVEKQSDEFYFAPHEESFLVKDVAIQDISVAAVLYFVPKPGNTSDAEPVEGTNTGILAADAVATEEEISNTNGSEDNSREDKTAKEDDFDQLASEPLNQEDLSKTPGDDAPSESSSPEQASITAPASIPAIVAMPAEPSSESLATDAPSAQAPTEAQPKDNRLQMITVYAQHGNKEGLAEAEILVGDDGGELKKLCTTNARGRCVIEKEQFPKVPVTLIAKAAGYLTRSQTVRLKDGDSYRFEMQPGHAIDFFLLERRYKRDKGISQAEITVNGRRMGKTDKFGYFSYKHTGPSTDLIQVSLRAEGYLPEVYSTDFVAAGEIQVTRYFTRKMPPKPVIAMLPVFTSGNLQAQNLSGDEFRMLAEKISRELQKSVQSSGVFETMSLDAMTKAVGTEMSASQLAGMKGGWQGQVLDSHLDLLLTPTLIVEGESLSLEGALVDNAGRTIAVAKENLPKLEESSALQKASERLVSRMAEAFPFEGSILAKVDQSYSINIGAESSRALKVGTELKVFGTQLAKDGRGERYQEIGRLRVTKMDPLQSTAEVLSLEPRSIIQQGDAVSLVRGKKAIAGEPMVRLVVREEFSSAKAPLSHVNLYLNDAWLATTDELGQAQVPAAQLRPSSILKLVKHGYEPHSHELTKTTNPVAEFQLKRKSSALRLVSVPAGAQVYLNRERIGQTPIQTPIPVPNGFALLEIDGGPGYKRFQRNLEIKDDIVDLTGEQKILLEEDLLASAESSLAAGRLDQALSALQSFPTSHSDFLFSQHRLGELLMTKKNDFAGAVQAFGKVVANPEVARFINKQFIGTHINLAIALFRLAEIQGTSDSQSTLQMYGQVVETLDGVAPQLRFVPKDQNLIATHNVEYYKALAKHKTWVMTADERILAETVSSWKDYLDRYEEAKDETMMGMQQNAKIYLKQAEASQQDSKAKL